MAADVQRQGLLERDSESDEEDRPTSPTLLENAAGSRSITFLNGLAIVIGRQIGSGIFSAPAVVSEHVQSPLAGLLVWLLSGLLVWTGASSLVELGTRIPRNGGMQEYLRASYGDFAGFMFSWIWISIAGPCSVAMVGLIFATYVNGLLLPGGGGGWTDKATALVAVWAITAVNCLGAYTGAKAANVFLVLKLFAVSSIIVTGFAVGLRDGGAGISATRLHGGLTGTVQQRQEPLLREMVRQQGGGAKTADVWALFGEYVKAIFAALWVYGGWETIGFVAGEMKDPIRDLPRVTNSAMSIVVVGFVLMNAALYIVSPIESLRGRNAVAVLFGSIVFGSPGRVFYTVIVSISALGSLNSNVFATSRLAVAAARRDFLPRFLSGGDEVEMSSQEDEARSVMQRMRAWPRWVGMVCVWVSSVTGRLRREKKVPVYPFLLNAVLASCYVLIGTFSALLTFIGITEYLIFFLTVLGVFRLRALHQGDGFSPPSSDNTNREKREPYRTHTLNPVIFCVTSVILVTKGVVTDLRQGLAILLFIVCGWVFYSWKSRGRQRRGGVVMSGI
ncbi:MAG: Y+L amino acid transporter [Geoglossum umbratile]|nr:MAG: Y+L amino acid transporter [Geoglossum umbratile]